MMITASYALAAIIKSNSIGSHLTREYAVGVAYAELIGQLRNPIQGSNSVVIWEKREKTVILVH